MKAIKTIVLGILFMGMYGCKEPKEADKIELSYENAWDREPIVDTIEFYGVKNYLKPNYLWFGFGINITKKEIYEYLRQDSAILFDTLNINYSYLSNNVLFGAIVKIDTSVSTIKEIRLKHIQCSNVKNINYVYTNDNIEEPCGKVNYLTYKNYFRLFTNVKDNTLLDSLLLVTKSQLLSSTDSTVLIQIDNNSVGDAFFVREKFLSTGAFTTESDNRFYYHWYDLFIDSGADSSPGEHCLYFY
jgi:hypothetical protein